MKFRIIVADVHGNGQYIQMEHEGTRESAEKAAQAIADDYPLNQMGIMIQEI